jgi:predicted PurR-regulated permease PerM
MDTLRNLFGNATAKIFRLVVVAGTIILISIFIVKPALETTEKISSDVSNFNNSINRTTDPNRIQRQIQRNINQTNRRVQRQINRATRRTQEAGGANPQALLRCVQRANNNAQKIAACAQRFN